MNTISVSEAKMKFSALVDAVKETGEETVITKNGRPVAVLVSPDEFESWRETLKIRFDADLMAEIKQNLETLKKEKTTLYTLDELLPES